ncbi:hypothetical protein B0H11DRAFT_2419975 [Mycena galericulata]|nr:hypothetical protein B0H11DRAFT_2419975 [Mycena galericulata]
MPRRSRDYFEERPVLSQRQHKLPVLSQRQHSAQNHPPSTRVMPGSRRRWIDGEYHIFPGWTKFAELCIGTPEPCRPTLHCYYCYGWLPLPYDPESESAPTHLRARLRPSSAGHGEWSRTTRVMRLAERQVRGMVEQEVRSWFGEDEVSFMFHFSPAVDLIFLSDGIMHLDTPFSRLLGKPPIMVAGMTPSTVKGGFVRAVLNAGYHVELAGGGHYNAAALRSKVAEIQSKIPPGVGITLNALYINPRQFGFQLPLWQEMRKEGLPIEGFCVAAGIPSTEKVAEIIEGLRNAGIRHVAFKPGSVQGIRQVVNIAAANPDFPVLQWTGVRAGGHHSYEDFHQPVLQTYWAIRQQSNISLVGGSGFGAADDVWPYLSGEWSVHYEMQPMPFDGFLFPSRVMVAKEAHTSSSVKSRTSLSPPPVSTTVIGMGTYVKPTGSILTEFDDTVFKLTKEKRVACKPWFGWKKDGSVVKELGDMMYDWFLSFLCTQILLTICLPILQDSLWAAEDIEAVFDQDPQRVRILQGPMAVKHSKVKDEPIKDLLGNINSALVQRLLESMYGGDESKVPTIDYLSANPTALPAPPNLKRSVANDEVVYKFGAVLPDSSAWLETLAGPEPGWLRALVTSTTIVQGTSYINNPHGPTSCAPLWAKSGRCLQRRPAHIVFKAVEIKFIPDSKLINVIMFEDHRNVSVPLTLQFEYKSSLGFAPIHEITAGRNTRIEEFYWKLCAVEQFCAVLSNQAISALVDVVFYRGITKQGGMERDSENEPCQPQPHLKKTFKDAALHEVVNSIATSTGSLLEIVHPFSFTQVGNFCASEKLYRMNLFHQTNIKYF